MSMAKPNNVLKYMILQIMLYALKHPVVNIS